MSSESGKSGRSSGSGGCSAAAGAAAAARCGSTALRSRRAVLLFSSSHMKFGAFPLLLLNSIRSEKSSSTIGSGRGLAGRLRGGGGKPLPLDPEEVEGRERRSRPNSEEAPMAPAGVEAEEETEKEGEAVTELRPRKERAGGGEEMDIPESGELLEEEDEDEEEGLEDKEEEGSEEEEADEGEVFVMEGLEEDEEVLHGGSAAAVAFCDALILESMLDVIMVRRMEVGGCHSTTSMLGLVLWDRKQLLQSCSAYR